jgi:glycosyltransferase involved in cell wall biosynthesis
MPEVSIIVPAYNEENYIERLIESVLKQTFKDFELIIIDDCSTDRTSQIIKSYNDSRIRYLRNDTNFGVSKSRNIGIDHAGGEYVFFIDADCIPLVNWIESGLKSLSENKKDSVGGYGKVRYATSLVSISDRIVESDNELLPGGNMVFKKKYLKLIGGMEQEFTAQEDRDLAFRIRKYGEIVFSEDMIVVHQRKFNSKKTLFADAKRGKNMVYFIKKHQDYTNANLLWRILYPKKLLIALFPILILLGYSIRGWRDVKTAFWMYIALWYMRFIIWRSAIENRIFII